VIRSLSPRIPPPNSLALTALYSVQRESEKGTGQVVSVLPMLEIKPLCRLYKMRNPFFNESRARICKRLWSPEIDSEESTPPSYIAWRAGTPNRVVVQARQAGNRFLGSLKGLQIPAPKSFRQQLCNKLVCYTVTLFTTQRP
jgi:hypothetical protein